MAVGISFMGHYILLYPHVFGFALSRRYRLRSLIRHLVRKVYMALSVIVATNSKRANGKITIALLPAPAIQVGSMIQERKEKTAVYQCTARLSK